MLLDFKVLVDKYDLKVNGVIHGGAHLAEEAELYHDLVVPRVFWIEANPFVLDKIQSKLNGFFGQYLIHALLLDEARDDVNFRITNYDGMSSSVFPWGTHTSFSPDTVVEQTIVASSTTLDQLDAEYDFGGVNMLNLDLEGAELMTLQGATKVLQQIDILYLEVRTDYVYLNAPLVDELDRFLSDFVRVETGIVEGQGWGDALWLRRSLLSS